jgi:hypothetical protein
MAPENRLCMLLSVALDIDGSSALRETLPALVAITKFADLFFIASDCFTCKAPDREQLVPMRR